MSTEIKGKEAVMARVIDTAMDLISEKSISSISIREIAKAAGVNHGLIHRHFGSKQNLIIHVVRHLDIMIREATADTSDLFSALESSAEAARQDPRIWRVPARLAMDGELELLKEFHSSFLKDLLNLAVRDGGDSVGASDIVREKFFFYICLILGVEMFGDYVSGSLEMDRPDRDLLLAHIKEFF